MKKLFAVAAVAVALTLAGCSAAPAGNDTAVTSSSAPAASKTSETPSAAAPVTIDQSTASEAPASGPWGGFATQREWYLRSLAGALSGTAPSDDQLVAAATLACKQLRAGIKRDAVRVVTGTGTLADQDNRNIVTQAVQVYCPELG